MAGTSSRGSKAKLTGEAADDASDRRQRILQAAVDQFAQKGFAAVRVDEIALAAGANKQLIYYYFRSKAELFDAVLEDMVRQTASMWNVLDSAPSLEAALWRIGEWTELTTRWWRLLAWEGLEFSNRDGAIHLEQARTESWSRWIALVRKAQGRGEVAPDVDAEMLALFLIALTGVSESIPQVVKMVTGADPDSAEFKERHTTLLRDLIEALAPRP